MPGIEDLWKPLGKMTFIPANCPVCGAEDAGPRHVKRIRDLEMKYWVCRRCEALYANPRSSVDTLEKIYASKDFYNGSAPGGDHLDYFDYVAGESYLRLTARGRVRRIQEFCPKGKLLEAAGAAGFFLIEAKLAGFETSGVEFSEPMAKYSSERWGVPVRVGSIEDVQLPESEYDVIASWGMFTIIQDPVGLIRKFHKALKPGGIWAFNTYYHDGLWPRVVGRRWTILTVNFSQIFTRKLLMDTIRKEGFELVARRRDTPHTDLLKLGDQLALNLGLPWLPRLLQTLGIQSLIVRIPLPDVYEYIWRKV